MKEKFQRILENKINLALGFLNKQKLGDIIKVDCYKEINCINIARNFDVLFPAGFLLHAISNLPKSKQQEVINLKKKLTEFLVNEENNFSYNYYTKDFNKTNKDFLLPDDLDDTVLINSALFKAGLDINPQILIKIIKLEMQEGGPYKTWYFSSKKTEAWSDIDPVVNAHLLYLASLLDIKLNKVDKYLIKQIKADQVSSKYYPTDLFFYFYISKYINQSKSVKLKKMVLDKLKNYNFNQLSELEKLLHTISLAYLGEHIEEKTLKELFKLQLRDGGFKIMPFCKDFLFDGKATYSSNRTVVTSVFMELLVLIAKNNNIELFSVNNISNEKYFFDQVQNYLKQDCRTFDQILQNYPIEKAFKAIMLPYFAVNSYKSKLTKQDKKNLVKISAASYYGWSGYTLLDKILDEQVYSKEYPIINSLFRKHYFLISEIFPNASIDKIKYSWDITDTNYYWEAKHARISKDIPENFDYKYIESRMISFLTICSAIIQIFDKSYIKKKQKDLYEILRAIVLIDQLNDDLHDWREDIENNILTFVTFELLKFKEQDLEEVFWEKVVPKVAAICRDEYNKAIKIVNNEQMTGTYLNKLLDNSFEPIVIAEKEIQNIKIVESYYNLTK